MPRTKNLSVEPLPEPTLEQRHNLASRTAESAVGLFTSAAMQLENSADALDQIADEAQAVADAHGQRAFAASSEAEVNRDRANKIRSLFA